MAGFKETPRQKMIGMMYLVLTALLALNVSKEILDAFVIVNDSVEKTSQNFTNKVNSLHTDFRVQNDINPDKVGPFFSKAEEAKKLSQDLVNYVDSVKFETIAMTDGIPFDSAKVIPLKYIGKKDNYNDPTRYLVGGEGVGNGEGYKLQKRLNTYKEAMLNLLPEDEQHLLSIGLETDGEYRNATDTKQDWVEYNFYHTILAADVTIFNKIVNEVRNAEYDVVNHLFKGISKEDFKFSGIQAKVLAESRYIFQGETFDAHVFLAAIDENSQPMMDFQMGAIEWNDSFANSARHVPGDSGFVKMSINTADMEPKSYTFSGRIGVKNHSGNIDYKYFTSSFIVAEPSANVAATKMNVFYRGVDNPVRISAAGVPASQLKYEIVGDGRIQETANGTIVNNLKQKRVETVKILVFSDDGDERKQLGEQEFRVKDLPPPDIFVTGMSAKGFVGKGGVLANPYIRSSLPEYINFEYKYKVTGFSMWVKKNGSDYEMRSSSNKLTPDMSDYIQSARKSSKLFFTDIEVQGPLEKFTVNTALIITLN